MARSKKVQARRAHLCGCPDPTRHVELRATLGTSYVAIRRGRLRAVLRLLQKAANVLRAFEADNVALARQNASLRTALEKTLDLSVDSPVFEGGLGGRTAVTQYRRNTGRLVQVMNEAGNRALLYGPDKARFFLRSAFLLDLETIFAAAPATREEAERRADLLHKLKVDEETDLLTEPNETGERARQDFIANIAASGVDTSTWELVRHSGEMGRAGGERAIDDGDGD